MNNKGFSLLQILLILVLLAIIIVAVKLKTNNTNEQEKENNSILESTFISEVTSIIYNAKTQFLTDSLNNKVNLCYDSKTNPLDLSSNDKKYYLKLNDKGEIIDLIVQNDKFEIVILDNNVINIYDIGTSSSDKKYKSTLINKDTEILNCLNN